MSPDTARVLARANVAALDMRTTELIQRIERETTDDERARKPTPKSWSLTEVTQHLALVAGGMLRTGRDARAPNLLAGAKFALLTVVLRSPIRFPVPISVIVPRPDVTWAKARANVLAATGKWDAFVESESFDATGFRHPLVGGLTPVQTTRFLIEHFDHHLRQVGRLFAGLTADRSSGRTEPGA